MISIIEDTTIHLYFICKLVHVIITCSKYSLLLLVTFVFLVLESLYHYHFALNRRMYRISNKLHKIKYFPKSILLINQAVSSFTKHIHDSIQLKTLSLLGFYGTCTILPAKTLYPLNLGHKFNVHKMFRRRPGRLLDALCTSVYILCPGGYL